MITTQKIRISYDYLDNHSAWRVEDTYWGLADTERFLLAQNRITYDKLASSWDLSDYIKNIIELAEENPSNAEALQSFVQELQLIDSSRDEDSATEYEFALESLEFELKEWDKRTGYVISNSQYDVLANEHILKSENYRDGLGSSWWCEISENEIICSNTEKLYCLTSEEEKYMSMLCEAFRYSGRITNNHEVVDFYKESKIEDKIDFTNFIIDIYTIFEANDDFMQWSNYKEWNTKNPELNSDTLSIMQEIYLKGANKAFLENLGVLAQNWEGTGVELLTACDIFNKK